MFNNKFVFICIIISCIIQGIHCDIYKKCVEKLNLSTYLCTNEESEKIKSQLQVLIDKNSRELCETNSHCKSAFGEGNDRCGFFNLKDCHELCIKEAQQTLSEKYPNYFSFIDGEGLERSACLCQGNYGEYCVNGRGLDSKCQELMNDNIRINSDNICNQCYLDIYEFSTKVINDEEVFDTFQHNFCL